MSNKTTVKDRVYQAIVDLHNAQRAASRQTIAHLTGLKFSQIDDQVKILKDDRQIRPVVNGTFEPVHQFPPNRAMSMTELADGSVKIELGDAELEMTPSEARMVGKSLMGVAMEIAAIRGERQVYDMVASLREELRGAHKRMHDLSRTVLRLQQQQRHQDDLFGDSATTVIPRGQPALSR
jgi:hypothetical protein